MSDQRPTRRPAEGDALDGSQEPSSLGASASFPASKKGDGDDGGRVERARRRLRPRGGPGRGFALVVVAVVLLALVPLVGSGFKRTPRDKVGISYGGGPIEGAQFQQVVQPGSGLFFNGLFDPLYLYPADQQNLIVSRSGSDDADAVVAPSRDRVQVTYQVAVFYTLNTDRLQQFHEQFGLKYEAYTSAGWQDLIDDTFRQQVENALQQETRRHDIGSIFGDAEVLLTIQTQVQETLSERLALAMGTTYFCAPTFSPGGECGDPTFVIKTIGVPDDVLAAFERNGTSAIAVETEQNEVEQREVEAQGIEALRDAAGEFGSVYALLKAIEAGSVDFWVLPDGGLTLQAPEGAGGEAAPAAPDPAPESDGAGG